MSVFSGIQGQLLEVTVVGCIKLKDTEWISRQDPYVVVEYGSTKYRTRTCTDGGKNPTFQEKFVFTLIEGLRELNVVVWNSNTLTYDDLIGSGKIQLQKVLYEGYDDNTWPLQDKKGRHAGEIRLITHYASANKPAKSHAPQTSYHPSAPLPSYAPSAPQTSYAPSAPPPPYANAPAPQAPLYSSPPPSLSPYPPSSYPAPSPFPSPYPPHTAAYPPQPYNQQPAPYPPTYPPTYPPPPSVYPPVYPPPPQDPHYYPQGSYPPAPYPPRPY